MSLSRLSIWISHLLALTAFATLTLSQALPLPLFFAGALFTFGSLWARFRGWSAPFSPRFCNVVTIFFFLFFVIDTFWISQSLIGGGVHFLIYLTILKLLTLKKAKDDLQLHVMAFFQLLATATWTSDLSFALAFILFLVLTTWSLIFYHLRKEEETVERIIPGEIREIITPPFFVWTNALTVLALAITILTFFSIPRIGTGLFESRQGRSVNLTGFSERVKLGTLGTVKLDPTIIMRIGLPGTPPSTLLPLYMRGTAFDRYRDGTWENTFSLQTPLQQTGTRFQVPLRPHASAGRKKLLHQEITLEPLTSSILFAASQPVFLDGRLTEVLTDPSGTLRLGQTPPGRISYHAVSWSPGLFPEEARLGEIHYPEDIGARYLQVEPRERLSELAGRITAGEETILGKVVAVQKFLATNYRYNLNIPPSNDPHPIEVFLFDQKEGYCEHYATAMVLLLRHAGIASRLVSGFLSGEWNPFGKYVLVREQDAHTWVEVYFPQSGWVLFDPTPSSPADRGTSLLVAYMDWMRTRWERYIVRYSILDQAYFVGEGWQWMRGGSLSIKWNRSWGSPSSLKGYFSWVLLLCFALAAWFARNVFLLRGGRTREIAREVEATRIYRRFLSLMSKKGWQRGPGETPLEFSRTPSLHAPLREGIEQLTLLYYRARFGPDRSDPAMLKKLQGLFSALKERADRIPIAPSIRATPNSLTEGSEVRPSAGGPLDSDPEGDRGGSH